MNKDYSQFYKIEHEGKKYIFDPYGLNPYNFIMGQWREETSTGLAGKIAPKDIQIELNRKVFELDELPSMLERMEHASKTEMDRYAAIALTWLQLKVKGIKTNANLQYIRSTRYFTFGKLYFYIYDAKYKNVLPIWDAFPIVLILDVDETHFLGLNFHYLKITDRVKLLNHLIKNYSQYKKSSDPNISSTKDLTLNFTYDILKRSKSLKYAKVCLKKYRIDHVKSKIFPLESHEWVYAVCLPVQEWKGKKSHVRPY